MKFSIEMIYESLDMENAILYSKHKTDFLIEHVKRYKDAQPVQSNILYIVTSSQIKNISVHSVMSFICVGSKNHAIFDDSNYSVISVPSKTDIPLLFEKVVALFERFTGWEQQAYTLILKKTPLQEVLNFCGKMLENPIALFDNQQSLILKSGSLPPDRADNIWKHVLKTGHSPKEKPSSYLAEQLFSSAYPFFYNSDNEYREIDRMIVRVQKDNAPFGCLSMTDVLSPFTATEYSVLFYTAQITELHLINSDEFRLYNSDTPWFLTQLFQGNSLDEETIRYNTALLGMPSNKSYQILVFSPTQNIDLHYEGAPLKSIKSYFKSTFIYIYQNQIIVLWTSPLVAPKKSVLDDLLLHHSLRCACSMIFTSFSDIYAAYMQCQTLLSKAAFNGNTYLDFHSDFLKLLKICINDSCDIAIMLFPNIRSILCDTKDYGTDLLTCLKTYIINGKNVSTTANTLSIHRHTVLYRLDRITELLGIDLKQLDEISSIHIYISCLLLLKTNNDSV